MPSSDSIIAAGHFPPTRWSVVIAARSDNPSDRTRALDLLAAAYWKPIYKYIRLKFSKPPDEAQDLTQGFFVELLARSLIDRFEPQKSHLRTWIRLCVDSFVLNEIKAASRQKRGGDAVHLALDFSAAEDELHAQAIHPDSIPSPEQFELFFEKEWIRSLFSSAVDDLRQCCTEQNKQTAFLLFAVYDLADDDPPSYTQLSERFVLSVTDVTNKLAWARREFRRFARERLRALCSSDQEYQSESKSLFGGSG
jgi:DNA-directed RNA polymerase specialized sigma24 family protein